MFRERLRPIEPMTSMLKGVSDNELRAMADAIAKLPPPMPEASPADPARVDAGARAGRAASLQLLPQRRLSGEENVPRIAGQREDYLVKALRGYKDNTRRGYDAQMADVVEPLTDAEFADFAHFLARLK